MPSASGNTEPYRNEPWRSTVSLWAAFLGNEAHFYKVTIDMNTSIASSYTDASNIHHVVNEFADIVPVVIGQIGECETNVVSARALHGALGVGRMFAHWIKDRIAEYEFVENQDYVIACQNWQAKTRGGHNRKDYHLTINMAKELAMVERNEQGRAIRRYFIQCEEALRLTAPEVAARYRRKLKARVEVANLFKPMCSALECSRTDQGKETQPHHYTNESNMITRIVLGGLTAK